MLKPTISVGEGLTDVVLGAGAGVNETLADIINLFDGDGNAVADWLKQGAESLRTKQFSDGAASAVGEELGSMATTAPIGSAVGNVAGKAYDIANKAMRSRTGTNAVNKLLGVKDTLNRALKTDEADNVFEYVFRNKELSPRGMRTRYNTDIQLAGKKPGVVGEAFTADKTATPVTRRVLDNANMTSLPDNGMLAVKGAERLFGSKIPLLSDISDTVGKYVNRLAAPLNKNAAVKVREQFINELMDQGYSRQAGLDAFEKYVLQRSNLSDTLKKPGSAIGALFGAGDK
jgi:hypothetical protein